MSEDTEQTRLGGLTRGARPSSVFRLFGSVSLTGLAPGIVPFTTFIPSAQQNGHGNEAGCSRLWRVRADALEVVRLGTLAPLTINQLDDVTDGLSRGGSGVFKVRVKVCDPRTNYVFDMDLGQPVELYASNVYVSILGPNNAFRVNQDNLTNTIAGLVVDSMVSASMVEAEASLGQREVRLTQHISVLATTQTTIVVPYAAVALHIFTGTGAAAVAWNRFIGSPALPGINVGTLRFQAGLSTQDSIPIGDETHLQTDLDAAFDRSFTLVWTIRP